MDNLTFTEQVIKIHPADPVAPLAGHIVVVFEKIGTGGEEFRFDLREGQRPPAQSRTIRSLFGERPQFIAFAVTAERQRRLTFSTNVTMDVALHTFALSIDLVYCISDPRLLVTHRTQDPLRRIRDEAGSLAPPQLAQREWSRVRSDFRGLEREVVSTVLSRLQRFASDYGVFVQEMSLNHRLGDSDFEDIAKREAAAVVALDDELEHERKERLNHYGHALEVSQHARVIESHDVRSSASAYVRYNEIADAAARGAIKAIEAASTSIHTPTELAQAVSTIRQAIEAMRDLGKGNGSGHAEIAGGTAIGVLPAAAQSGLGIVIAELLTETEQMSWPSISVKQQLQGSTLHLIAELMTPDATDVTVTGYRERLSDARAAAALPIDQSDYFGKYIDSDRLRRRLR
jgi:hypothetical protein